MWDMSSERFYRDAEGHRYYERQGTEGLCKIGNRYTSPNGVDFYALCRSVTPLDNGWFLYKWSTKEI